MEGFFAEKVANSTSTLTNNNTEQIDLTLKLSPCGQNAEDEEEKYLIRSSSSMANRNKEGPLVASSWQERSCSLPLPLPLSGEGGGVMKFGELQTMRRVRTGKRLLLEKQRRNRAAAVAAPLAGGEPSLSSFHATDKFNMPVDSCQDEGEASSDTKTSMMQENEMITRLENPAKKHKTMNANCVKGYDSMYILRQMPNVTTTGDGPNGKRIEGLLYKYREGHVCIVCVCHGRFLSPAEFVMHAGGKEVVNPMRHITVCSNFF